MFISRLSCNKYLLDTLGHGDKKKEEEEAFIWTSLPHAIFGIFFYTEFLHTSLVAQTVKHLPTMRETWVQSLGREDLLEKEMATHSSILSWKIPWTEEPSML